MVQGIIVAVVGGLIVLVLAGLAAWAWKPTRKRITEWWARRRAKADEAAELAEYEQLETLRRQVADRARKVGKPMPVHASGNQITYSDGRTMTFIPDFQRYRRLMETRQVDFRSTVNREPPIPLSRRSGAWMEKWLEDNPEP